MGRKQYTTEQMEEFVKLAAEEGITPAMDELGYPGSWNTAKKWLDNAGVEVTLDALQRRAKSYDLFYSSKEKLVAMQALLNRIYRLLESESDLSPEELNKLAAAGQRAVQTLALIEGTPTGRTETVAADKRDIELVELLNEQHAKNTQSEQSDARLT